MKKNIFNALWLLAVLMGLSVHAQSFDEINTKNHKIRVYPVYHGSLVLTLGAQTLYIDPFGGSKRYEHMPKADFVLITDIHGDHLHKETLDELDLNEATFIIPPAVAEKLSKASFPNQIQLKNGQGIHRSGMFIKAIPMYNLPETDDSFHIKGRGNGYVIHFDDFKMYVSGDTEDIPEMRQLIDIDLAFVCMNLPFTMDINQAADAVLQFKPKIVYPYHYRGRPDMSDTETFKSLVNSKDKSIEVRLRNWYPE